MPHLKLDAATAELIPGRLGALKTVREWKALAKYSSHRNHKLFYVDSGEGEVILCLHGFPLTSWSWGKIWPRLSHHYRMLSFDRIGTGYSDKPQDYSHSVADDADQVQSLLNSLDIKKLKILAHGSGVTIAEELLARQMEAGSLPDFVIDGVIFLNGGIVPSYKSPFIEHVKQVVGQRKTLDGADEVLFGRMLNTICGEDSHLNPQFIHESWFLLNRKAKGQDIQGLIQYIADREQYAGRWESVLNSGDVPMHCIIGLADPVWGRHMMSSLRSKATFEHLITLPDVGNFPHLEAPSLVVKHVTALCAE